jgi:hypothetical protein
VATFGGLGYLRNEEIQLLARRRVFGTMQRPRLSRASLLDSPGTPMVKAGH